MSPCAYAQENANSVQINSKDGMQWDASTATARFLGDVEVKGTQWNVYSNEAIANFSPENNKELVSILALGKTRVNWEKLEGSSQKVKYTVTPHTLLFFGEGEKVWQIDDSQVSANGDGVWNIDAHEISIDGDVRFISEKQGVLGRSDHLRITLNQDNSLKDLRLEGHVTIRLTDHHFRGDEFTYNAKTQQGYICGGALWVWKDVSSQAQCFDYDLVKEKITTRGRAMLLLEDN